jgi:hypothetical protein
MIGRNRNNEEISIKNDDVADYLNSKRSSESIGQVTDIYYTTFTGGYAQTEYAVHVSYQLPYKKSPGQTLYSHAEYDYTLINEIKEHLKTFDIFQNCTYRLCASGNATDKEGYPIGRQVKEIFQKLLDATAEYKTDIANANRNRAVI